MNPESWWPAVLAVAAWPVGVVVIVIVVLLLTRGDQQPAVLRAIADLVRAVRAVPHPGALEPEADQRPATPEGVPVAEVPPNSGKPL